MAAKKVRRFILRFFIAIIVVVIALIILWESGLAGGYLLRLAGSRIGVELTADRVRVGLDGTLRLNRFSATFEDDLDPFFTAHRVSIATVGLREFINSLEFNVTAIELVSPTLTLRSDVDGQWNIEPLLTKKNDRPEESQTTGTPQIPDVSITNGTFHFERSGKAPVHVSHIALTSTTTDDGQIKTAMTLPGNNRIKGIVDLDSLAHKLTVHIEDVAALPEPAKAEIPAMLTVHAEWEGHISSRQPWAVGGKLIVHNLSFGEMDAALQAAVAMDAESMSAKLDWLTFNPWANVSKLNGQPDAITADQGVLIVPFAAGRVDLEGLGLSLLGGHLTVDASVNLKHWQHSKAAIVLTDIHPSILHTAEGLEEMTINGAVTLEPATDPRPMEPMAVSLDLRLEGVPFEAAGLGHITAEAYLGETRLVTQNAAIPVFGGVVSPWFSLTRRADEIFVHIISDFKDIDLNHLVQTFNDDTDTVPGTLNGTLRCRTSGALRSLSGGGEIHLTNSDLVRTRIVGAVLSAMNLTSDNVEPQGQGTIKLTAHGQRFEITSFEYYNRGIEIRGAGAVQDFTQGKASPISGFVTGSARPLRQSRIPGTRELDQLLKGLQAGLTSVKVEGTLGQPEPRIVTMTEIHDAFRALLQVQIQE